MSADNDTVTVFAPATVANVGPGYDVLGLAVAGVGDEVTARRVAGGGVTLLEVTGTAELSSLPQPGPDNTAVVAARAVLSQLAVEWGVELRLKKGLPVGSGLGSSGASAAAAATAVNLLAGGTLAPETLIDACAAAERVACGSAHRDNVAPALLGGIVLVRPTGGVTRVETTLDLALALVTPERSLPTREARAAIPECVPLADAVHNAAHLAAMVYALATADVALLGEAIDDRIAEPRRAPLIPGFAAVKAAALAAGALGASISGAGPTIFALCLGLEQAEVVLRAMSAALDADGCPHRARAAALDLKGARAVAPQETRP